MKYDSVEHFLERAKNFVMKNKEQQEKKRLQDDILKKLVEVHEFDVPNTFLIEQEKSIRDQISGTLKSQGMNAKQMEEYFVKWQDDMKQRAVHQVKTALILRAISEEQKITCDESDLDKLYETIAADYGSSKDDIKNMYAGKKDLLQNLTMSIIEDKTFDYILAQAK